MTVHAIAVDLDNWLPADLAADLDPADIDRLLTRASELVDHTIRAAYQPDDVTDVLRDATCAVVEAWLEVGETNDIDGLAGTQVSVSGYSGARAPTIPPRAYRLLAGAGLLQPADTSGVCW